MKRKPMFLTPSDFSAIIVLKVSLLDYYQRGKKLHQRNACPTRNKSWCERSRPLVDVLATGTRSKREPALAGSSHSLAPSFFRSSHSIHANLCHPSNWPEKQTEPSRRSQDENRIDYSGDESKE